MTHPVFDPLSALNSRNQRQDGFAYKLKDTPAPYGLDAVFSHSPDVDEQSMSAWIPYADGNRRDGVGDLLLVEGIRTERHRSNPICLFDHGKYVQLPIGLCEDPDTGFYVNEIDPVSKTARVKCFFYQGTGIPGIDKGEEYDHAVFCEQIFDLWVKRFIRAGSIGYQVIKAMELPPDRDRGTPQGLYLQEVLMLEASAVVLPANGDTVRKMLCMPTICGKKLSPVLVKSLQPYAPPRKVQMGYTGKGGSIPHHENVAGFQVGDTVIARSYLNYYPGNTYNNASTGRPGNIDTFARTGDRLKVVEVLSPVEIVVERRDGQRATFNSSQIRKGKSLKAGMKAHNYGKTQSGLPTKVRFRGYDFVKTGKVGNDLKDGTRAAEYEAIGEGEEGIIIWVREDGVINDAIGLNRLKSGDHLRSRQDYDNPLSRSKVPPSKWKPGAGAMKDLRKKYTPTKALRRRVKRSSPGSSVMYVSGKDLRKAKRMAEERGLKFAYLGQKNGRERIKLMGDDNSIDEVAKNYGIPLRGVKSLNATYEGKSMAKELKRRVKQDPLMNGEDEYVEDDFSDLNEDLTEDSMVEGDLAEDVMTEEEAKGFNMNEPLGAQVLKRLHEDAGLLMQEYDEMMPVLENEGVKKLLQKKLEGLASFMGDCENCWGKTYKDLGDLGGGEGGGEDELSDADLGGEPMPDDSDEELPTPSPEEAVEGMETANEDEDMETEEKSFDPKKVKQARSRYGKKGMKTKTLPRKEKTTPKPPVTGGLSSQEKQSVGEASDFLGEIANPESQWDDEKRFMSFHYHKTLDGIGTIEEVNEELNEGHTAEPGTPEWAAEEAKEPEHQKRLKGKALTEDEMEGIKEDIDVQAEDTEDNPADGKTHRKMCKECSQHFHDMAYSPEMTDDLRGKSMDWHKRLKALTDQEVEEIKEDIDVQEEDTEEEPVGPGDMGEKSVTQVKQAFIQQNKELQELHRQITALTGLN